MKNMDINRQKAIDILSRNGKVKREDCKPSLIAQATWDAFERGYLKARELECEPVDWLIANRKYISIRGIESELGLKDTLQKAVNGTQKLPDKHKDLLIDFIMGLQNPTCEGKKNKNTCTTDD